MSCRYTEEGWILAAMHDRAGRRGLWYRIEPRNVTHGIQTVEVCGGREGDDAYARFAVGDVVDSRTLDGLEDALGRSAVHIEFYYDPEDQERIDNPGVAAIVEAQRQRGEAREEAARLRSAIKHMQSEVMLILHNALDRQEGTPLERCREAHTLASRAYSIAQAAFEGLGEDEFDLRGSFSHGGEPEGRHELRKATHARLGTEAKRGGPRYEDAEDETSDALRGRLHRVEDVVRHALGRLDECPWCGTASAACRDGCPLTDIERALTGKEG